MQINMVGRRAYLLTQIAGWTRSVTFWAQYGKEHAEDRRRGEHYLRLARREFRDMVRETLEALEFCPHGCHYVVDACDTCLPEEWLAVDLKVERAKREARRDAFLAQGFSENDPEVLS